MPISVPAYSTARKPQRKRKSDGSESGKSRKGKSTGEKGNIVEEDDGNEDSEKPHIKPPRKRKLGSSESGKSRKGKSAAEKGSIAEDDEGNDVNEDWEKPHVKPPRNRKLDGRESGKSRKGKSAGKKGSAVEDVEGNDGNEDSEKPRVIKPPRRKRPKVERVTESCSLAEDVDTICIPDSEDMATVWKRSADRLTEKLRSPLLQVIEAQDADDFESEGPAEVSEQDPCGKTGKIYPALDQSSSGSQRITSDVIREHFGAESCGKVRKVPDDVSLSDSESCTNEHHPDVVMPSVCRSRVRTPPTFEETSAALTAIEEADRLSPIDVMGLVERWKRENTAVTAPSTVFSEDAELPTFGLGLKSARKALNGGTTDMEKHEKPEQLSGTAPSIVFDDDELPTFDLGLKSSSRKVLNGATASREFAVLEAGPFKSDAQRSKLVMERTISECQKPVPEMVESSVRVDQRKGSSEYEEQAEVGGMLADHSHYDVFADDTISDFPDAAADFNRKSVRTPKNPGGHVSKADDRKIQDDRSKKENLGFSQLADISSADQHAANEQRHSFRNAVLDRKVSQRHILRVTDEFSQFDDTNDDEFLAAAVATPVVSSRTNRAPIINGPANVSGNNVTAENSQLTFTQALACVHDSMDVTRMLVESPWIGGKSEVADCGSEKLAMKVERPHFDLGFELSDDDDGDDDDDDIIPPSPPLSSSLKSSIRLGSRANSLITISRQSSRGSITVSGSRTGKPEDALDADCTTTQKSDLLTKRSDVENALVSHLPGSLERQSPRVVTESLSSEVQSVAAEEKSRVRSPVSGPDTVTVEKKLRDRVPISEWSMGVLAQKSRDLPPAVQTMTADLEKKSRQQAVSGTNTVPVDEKSGDLARCGHVAVIHPCVRSLATPTLAMPTLATPTLADQSEMISPPSALSSSTPFKPCVDEKCESFF